MIYDHKEWRYKILKAPKRAMGKYLVSRQPLDNPYNLFGYEKLFYAASVKVARQQIRKY
jgi:hypothetical protein